MGSGAAKSNDSKLQLDDMNVDQFMDKGFFEAMDAESGEDDAEVRTGLAGIDWGVGLLI